MNLIMMSPLTMSQVQQNREPISSMLPQLKEFVNYVIDNWAKFDHYDNAESLDNWLPLKNTLNPTIW